MTGQPVRHCTEQYPCVCKTPAGAAPTPAPTPVACPVRAPTSTGIVGKAVCDCPDPLHQKTAFADSRRRRQGRRRRVEYSPPSSMAEDPISIDTPVRYICNYTGPPTQAPTPAPTPLPNCPTLAARVGIKTCWPSRMDRPECSYSKNCGCLTTAYPKRVVFSDSRRRTAANTDTSGAAVPDDPLRYHCAQGDSTTAPPTTHRRRRAPGAPTTTRAPRRPTRAPTPTQKFRLRRPKLVLLTKLSGFTVATFTRGVRWAYRRAFARRYGIADVLRVIITNIRGGGSTRHLSSSSSSSSSRALAAALVQFDIQVEANTTAEATALNAEVKGGESTEEEALVADFKTELRTVAREGSYPEDVPADYAVPAAVTVVTEVGQVALETGAPTPAPTGADASPVPLPAIVGAVVAVAAIAAVVLRRSKMSKRTAVSGQSATSPATDSIELPDVYPSAIKNSGRSASTSDEQSDVI